MVARVCRELGVEMQPCSTAKTALEKVTLQRFHGVIVDDEDSASAASLLRDLQASTGGRTSLVVVLAQSDAALDAVFGAGTQLVIYKPLTHERLRNGLRAIRILMGRRQQRSSARIKVNVTGSLTVNGTEKFPAKILDLSEGGAALSLERPFPSVKLLKLSFALPGEQETITTAAELVWKDIRGNLGIEFVNNDPAFNSLIANWTKARSPRRAVGNLEDSDPRLNPRKR